MKNKILTIIFLISLFAVFTVFVCSYKSKYEVIDVLSANMLVLDLNRNGIADNNETVCIHGIESFQSEPDEKFLNKYSTKLKLSKNDIINLWYLGREYGQKILLNKNVSYKFYPSNTSKCANASIQIDGTDYANLLSNSGFALKDGKVFNPERFKQNLEISKKLNLVVLNHHSNKYHTLDCEYGNMAHDKVIIPFKQLPKGMKPCHFCHNIKDKHAVHKKVIPITGVSPSLKLFGGNIAIYKFDYTKHLKPNSNCSTEVCALVVNNINKAQDSIDIAIFGYEDVPAITSALQRASARGVNIRFVYDENPDVTKNFYKSNDIIKNLSTQSQSDRFSPDGGKLMHNKFWIFDRSKVITGSMNFSKSGLSGYDVNDVVVLNSPEIAELYEAEFEQMLSGRFHNYKTRHKLPNKFILNNTEIEVYFSPQDKSSVRIIELINGAISYIYVPTFLITHKGISDALINARKRNVDVRLIIDANSVNTRNTRHKLLKDNGILLKAENYAGKLHSKTMIIDDEYLIIGSMNFSNSGENKNDENMLVIKNSVFAKNYKEFFMYLWKVIPDKYLKFYPRAESADSIGSCSDGVDNNFDGKIDSDDAGCKLKK